ncbi:MAG: tRNA pseudouridine(55) synthase TruB [Acidimicrobiales bacterium]
MARSGKGNDEGPHGVVVIDKPAGWTSHDVVAKSRGVLGTRKVGHSGTLDPDATGVLVLGVGKATRLLRFLTELPKSYVGEIVLGTETSTLDAAGDVTAVHDMAAVTDAQVRAATVPLTGAIEQIPPMVSAVKIDGKRLHELAREGKEVDRPARPVTVFRYDVEPVPGEPGVWRCEVDCSSGTYVRTLAADLGAALGGGAHLRALRRTAVGGFTLADAGTIEKPVLRPVADAVRHLDQVVADEEMAVDVGHGKRLDRDRLGVGDSAGPWAVSDAAGALLAVYEAHKGATKPALVIPR